MRLSSRRVDGGSALAELRQQGSMKALFPLHDGPGLTAMLLNTAGGVTGGDRIATSAEAGADSRLTVTTQAAERLYAALPDETGSITNRLTLGPRARLDWLPQETILFDRAAVSRDMAVQMAPDATLLLVEPLMIGRPAMGETVRSARVSDRVRIRRGDRLILLDRLALTGDIAARFARPGIAAGAAAVALVVYAAPDAEARLAPLRDMLPPGSGAALPRAGLLMARLIAADAFELRRTLVPALTYLHGHALPRSWML